MAPTWREERRLDRLAAAQIDRDAEASRSRLRREERQARHAERRAARKQRAARFAKLAAWLSDHVTDLLFVPVIAVPGLLSWTAMAGYGYAVFGPAGVVLPAFSEGSMWAFAGATTISRHRHPERPVWHLRAGTAVFAAVAAAMNFTHGVTPAQGAQRSIGTGVVMALVSVAGVVAHQLITAGPRRSRAERAAARADRAAWRREQFIRRAVRRHAPAVVDEAGQARLVHQPGLVTLSRSRLGRVSVTALPDAPGEQSASAPAVCPWPRPAPLMSGPGGAPRSAPASAVQVHPSGAVAGAPGVHPVSAPQVHPEGAPASAPEVTAKKRRKRAARETPEQHFAGDLAAGKLPSARQVRREMHVGQDRAGVILEDLARLLEQQPGVVVPMEARR